MNSPLISVVMPVKNCAPYLREAVDSILCQTLGDFEIVLVDDHSTDGGVEQLGIDDPRLRLFKSSGSGVIDAANYAAAMSRGLYLARMDADDICHPERLELQVAFLEQHAHIGIVASQVDIFAHGGVSEGYRLYEEWVNGLVTSDEIHRSIFIENPMPNPTMMLRRDLFEQLGGYRDTGGPEDYDFFLRAWSDGIKFGKVAKKLLRWRDRSDRTTRVDARYSPKSFMQTRATFLASSLLKDHPAIIWGAGRNGPALARMILAEGGNISGFIDINPRRIGKQKVFRPVYAPEHVENINDELIIVCVAARGARQEIRSYLDSRGKVEGVDYWVAV